jgi:WD40 repeat protein
LATGDDDGGIFVWDTSHTQGRDEANENPLYAHVPIDVPVYSLAFSRFGEMLAAGDANGNVQIWQVAPNARLADHTHDFGEPVRAVAFLPVSDSGHFTLAVAVGSDNSET